MLLWFFAYSQCPLDSTGCILKVHKVIMVVCLVDCPCVINLQYTFLLIFRQSTIFAYYYKIFYLQISLRSVMVLNGTMIAIKNSHNFFLHIIRMMMEQLKYPSSFPQLALTKKSELIKLSVKFLFKICLNCCLPLQIHASSLKSYPF